MMSNLKKIVYNNSNKIISQAYVWHPHKKLIIPEVDKHINDLVSLKKLISMNINDLPMTYLKTGQYVSCQPLLCVNASKFAHSNVINLDRLIKSYDCFEIDSEDYITARNNFDKIYILCLLYYKILIHVE